MASVAKWLRQRIVVPPFVGSSPIVRPSNQFLNKTGWQDVAAADVGVIDNRFALLPAFPIAPLS